jgi:hypothetical protein
MFGLPNLGLSGGKSSASTDSTLGLQGQATGNRGTVVTVNAGSGSASAALSDSKFPSWLLYGAGAVALVVVGWFVVKGHRV